MFKEELAKLKRETLKKELEKKQAETEKAQQEAAKQLSEAEEKPSTPIVKIEVPQPVIKEEVPQAVAEKEVTPSVVKVEVPQPVIKEEVPQEVAEKEVTPSVVKVEVPQPAIKEEEPQEVLEKEVTQPEVKVEVPPSVIKEENEFEEEELPQEIIEKPVELSPMTEMFEEIEPIDLSDIAIEDITLKESNLLETELIEKSIKKMTVEKEEIPLVRFEGDASAPIIRYDVPSPSAYVGTLYIETDIGMEYFGGDSVFKIDPNATEEEKIKMQRDLFNTIKKRFLRENHEELKHYFASISREDLEKELEFYALKEEEIGKEILQQAKLEAAKKALKAAKLKADQLRVTADQKQQHAQALATQFSAVQNTMNNVQNWYNFIKLTPAYWVAKPVIDQTYNKAKAVYNAKKAQLQTAQNDAADAQQTAQDAENEVKRAEERITEIGSEEASILDLMNLTGMGETLAKYTLFNYLMEIAWTVDNSFPTFVKSMGGTTKIKFAKSRSLEPRLIFVETHKLTNLPGDYGAGTILKTFSLLPGEETEISIKTYKKTREEIKEASSILDSYTEEKADEFEKGVQQETARSSQEENSSSFNVSASAGVNLGYVNASVSAGYEQGSSSSRSSSAKNTLNATEKHAQKASAKRDVSVNTSFEKSVETGEETSFMRKIENINVSRTLNFTFRQMNQQFHSILHLVNLRIGFYNGYPGSFRLYSLPELKHIVVKYMNISNKTYDEIFQIVKAKILQEYTHVLDYQNTEKVFIEEKSNGNGSTYLRVIPPLEINGNISGKQEYHMREAKADQPADIRFIDGVILGNKVITMRTDGVIVESLLGKANALDDYSLQTREETVRYQALTNEKLRSEINKTNIGLKMIEALVKSGKVELASTLYREIFGVQEGLDLLEDILGTKKELNKLTVQ